MRYKNDIFRFSTILNTFGFSKTIIKTFAKRTNGVIANTVTNTIIANQVANPSYTMTIREAVFYLENQLSKYQILKLAKPGLIRYTTDLTARGSTRTYMLAREDIVNIKKLIDTYFYCLKNANNEIKDTIQHFLIDSKIRDKFKQFL